MNKYFIQTFGCQMNVADSDLMAVHLAELGMTRTDTADTADVVLINTCAVRDHAEHKVFSFLGRIEPLKKTKPGLLIIVAGCMAERLGAKLKRRFPIVDLVVGAKDIEHFPHYFDGITAGKGNAGRLLGEGYRGLQAGISAFVTIVRGCENFCSYCIVPYVRGKEISRPADEILKEIRHLAERGTREVTLLGQNVNSYRDGSTDFTGLLAMVSEVPGIERIRFMTSHPKDLSDRLIDALAMLPKVCEHLHLPLQSGSDGVLAAMNRRYTAGHYLSLIAKLRQRLPGISFTTDILVGFPGETDEDFAQTVALIKAVQFDHLFAFKYSPRPGTAAAGRPDDIPRETKERRHAAVLDLANSFSAAKNATIVGTLQEVLVESRHNTMLAGRTRTNKKVYFSGDDDLIGRLVTIRITDTKINTFTGIKDK
jgi:tRNA-2-methylthio-N6-dimethylallyladenosine synthase